MQRDDEDTDLGPGSETFKNIYIFNMRIHTLYRASPSSFSRCLARAYATQTPLVKAFDVKAPGSGRIRVLSLVSPLHRAPNRAIASSVALEQ